MTIDVTQNDIDNGTRACCYRCPVALAIGRAFPKRLVTVGPDAVWVSGGPGFDVSPQVADFIHSFDSGFSAKPFSFEL